MEKPNISYIKKLSDGDKIFEEKIISILKKEFLIEKEIYEKSINVRDFKQTAEIVHKIKHKISILGLEKGYNIANEYESNLNGKCDALTLEFRNILTIITTYLKGV